MCIQSDQQSISLSAMLQSTSITPQGSPKKVMVLEICHVVALLPAHRAAANSVYIHKCEPEVPDTQHMSGVQAHLFLHVWLNAPEIHLREENNMRAWLCTWSLVDPLLRPHNTVSVRNLTYSTRIQMISAWKLDCAFSFNYNDAATKLIRCTAAVYIYHIMAVSRDTWWSSWKLFRSRIVACTVSRCEQQFYPPRWARSAW